MEHWIQRVSFSNEWKYLATVLVFSIAIRAIHAGLAGFKFAHEAPGGVNSWTTWTWWIFRGWPDRPTEAPANYWYSFVIGLGELAAYPILLAAGELTAIGAWVGLKTVAQWKVWSEDRNIFNLFIIGNMLSLFGAVLIVMLGVVEIKPPP